MRDAVPVCFFEDGAEKTQYRNIDIPDSLKTLEIMDFGFDISAAGKITFRLHFDNDILPVDFPPAREKMTRAEKAAAKAAKTEEAATEVITDATADDDGEVTTEAAGGEELAADTPEVEDAAETEEPPAIPETRFNVTGDQRKKLVTAIGAYLDQPAKYLGAPSYAYMIGEHRVDKTGALIGEASPELLAALAEQGFTPDKNEAA